MTTVFDILRDKDGTVHVVDPNATVFEAIARMARFRIGSLVVCEDGRVSGIVTERDYLQKVALRSRTSRTTLVREIMSSPVVTAGPHEDVGECLRRVFARRVRYLPVISNAALVGIVSRGDLVRACFPDVQVADPEVSRSAAGAFATAARAPSPPTPSSSGLARSG